ncbi:DUF5682 family protein [Rhizobium leguminosarum]|uniref:DUF5682 family protein n=1 Tax=Rhizobium leguminosarum TaxID=384 RepID=UPI00103CFACB|nr:DUF5682 family protein [Rhizobium leguminosarum]TBZ06423.1 hypothetical protein E0H33_33670 [Rhizobium leguminosarum bv. viciae]
MEAEAAAAERQDFAAYGQRLTSGEGGFFFFPIRHHSPACALHLAAALAEIRPRAIVLEMPADFAPLLPLLSHPDIRLPIAIVSVADGEHASDERLPVGYWPFSATSPEWAALRLAGEFGSTVILADRESGARLAATREEKKRQAEEDGEGEPRQDEPREDETGPALLTDEGQLAYSHYADGLVKRLGVRDFNEAWDRLFESRAAEQDWRGFFRDVGIHCALSRLATPAEEIAADDTMAREACMRAAMAKAEALSGEGPIAVITGGFHTPVMIDPPAEEAKVQPEARPGIQTKSYLIRYTHEHLDRINGYGAGMPSPRWYERLQQRVAEGNDDPFTEAATDVMLDLTARLRRELPNFTPPLPSLSATIVQAQALADLRGLFGPGRAEILDAARSCLLKGEDPRTGSPLMEALLTELTGEGIGEVPRGAGAPPLVEAVRSRARALGFRIEDGTERNRLLDIHRKPRHLAASRFLHVMTLLGTGFGRCLRGPDWAGGVATDVLFEEWTYRWSPAVESRLVALSIDGDTVERAADAILARRVQALGEEGQARNAHAAIRLLMIAAQAGLARSCGALIAAIGPAVATDPDFGRVAVCLSMLDNLQRGRKALGFAGMPGPDELRLIAYRRAIDLLPDLETARDEDVPRYVDALATLNEIAEAGAQAREGEQPLDLDLLDEGVAALIDADLAPRAAGAVAAIGHMSGRLSAEALATRVIGPLQFSVGEPPARVEALAGLLAVQPALLKRTPALLERLDLVLAGFDEADFIEVLPALRLAFTALAPDETDALAAVIAQAKGSDLDLAPRFSGGLTEAEMLANARLNASFAELMQADGLGLWLEERAP